MKPFLIVDHEVTDSIRYFIAIGTDPKLWHSSGNVLGVIDGKTVVVTCLGRGNSKFTAVLKVASTRNMTRETRIGTTHVSDHWLMPQKEPWIVTGLNGLDDPGVAALLRMKPGSSGNQIPVLEQVSTADMRKHRLAYDETKKTDADKPSP